MADSAPPWATPGDLSAKLYLTTNCGLWLSLFGNPDYRTTKAAEFLQMHLDQDGHLPSFLHTHWLAGGLWHKLNWRTSTERVFEYLDIRIKNLAVSNLSWLIPTMRAAGVPTSHHLMLKQPRCWSKANRIMDIGKVKTDPDKMFTRLWKPCEPCNFVDGL